MRYLKYVCLSHLCLLKLGDVSGSQRVYLKDLQITKVKKGTDIQVTLVSTTVYLACY